MLKLIENSKGKQQAALVFAVLTLLHEQVHRGNLLNRKGENYDQPNIFNEDGAFFIDEVYTSNPQTAIDYWDFTFEDDDWQRKAINAGKSIRADMKKKQHESDVPRLGFNSETTKHIQDAIEAGASFEIIH